MHEAPVPPQADPRRQTLLLILASLFIGFFVCADLMGAKCWNFTIFGLRPRHLGLGGEEFIATVGILAFPLTFILTDIINEYFGKRLVRALTVIAIAVMLILQPVVQTAVLVPAVSFIPNVSNDELQNAYKIVLGPTWPIIIGSMTAFLIGQFLDIGIFTWLRRATGGRFLWLRAQGSTVVSQLIDSFIVIFIAFVIIPAIFQTQTIMSPEQASKISLTNYTIKFIEAVALTPLLYIVHYLVDAWLGKETAEELVKEAHPADPV
jgi:uncharacterized integral membrane protein (TIGR00697 family)